MSSPPESTSEAASEAQSLEADLVATTAPLPRTILAAAIMWLIYGAIAFLGGLSTLATSGGAYVQIVFGLIFLITGIQVLLGRASSLLASGIVCVILGPLSLFLTLLLFVSNGLRPPPWWLAAPLLLNAVLLVASGVLAIVGNGAFKEWRLARGLVRQSGPPATGCPTCHGPLHLASERRVWTCYRCYPSEPPPVVVPESPQPRQSL